MEELQYHLLAQVEERHWWHSTLRQAIREALDRHSPDRQLKILDIGCGTGGVLSDLAQRHQTVGLDLSLLALAYCRERRLPRLVGATMERLPVADDCFDVVLSIDSLSHLSVDSEATALAEHRRVLRTDGLLILQASAFKWLRGRHDEQVHQRRRFTLGEINDLLAGAGFETIEARYRLAFLPPLMSINNLLRGRRSNAAADIELPHPWINSFLHRAAIADLRWGRRLPLGSSVFCLARRSV